MSAWTILEAPSYIEENPAIFEANLAEKVCRRRNPVFISGSKLIGNGIVRESSSFSGIFVEPDIMPEGAKA